jgi:septal ring factor EnvC (AmiA/AmiB activator)
MSPALSKSEIAKQIKELRTKISGSKSAIKAEFRAFRKVSKAFAKATAEYKKAKAAYDKKPKAKQERKLDDALDSFYRAHDDYREVYKLIDSYFNTVEQGYNEICDLLVARGAHRKMEKTALKFEKYRDWLENKTN